MPDQVMENVCLSGGADGSDLQWGMMAGSLGHQVIHWSFAGHRTSAPPKEVVRLTEQQLAEANLAVSRANQALGRHWPSRSESTNNLLRRNWYQVKDTQSLYAVGNMENRSVKGGTAWAVQMYMDRFLHDGEPLEGCQLYFYDQVTNIWWQWRGKWEMRVSQPPVPKGVWAGVGTRELTLDGKWMIRKVMGGYDVGSAQIASAHPLRTTPMVGEIIYVPHGRKDDLGQQMGGWAVVNRIQETTEDQWVSVTEYVNTYFSWRSLAPQQQDLRTTFGLNHALTK